MRKFFITGCASALALAATPALAQDGGVYVSLTGGLSKVSDTEVEYYDVGGTFGGAGTTDRAQTSAELQNSAAFKGAIGYDFGPVRGDIEISYSRNKVRSITINSVNGAPVTLDAADRQDVCDYLEASGCSGSGNTISFTGGPGLRQLGAMANLWVDIPIGGTIVPYAGGGVGAVGFEMDGEGTGKFAWQLGAGVAVKVSGNVALTVDFRHRQVSGEEFPWDANSGFEVGRIKTNSVTAGIRIGF